jgi:hypothetical protein
VNDSRSAGDPDNQSAPDRRADFRLQQRKICDWRTLPPKNVERQAAATMS